MIRISQIDDELSIYKNNTVVLLGIGNGFKPMLELLKYFKVEISFICDNNKENWGTTRHGLKVISPPEMKKMIQSENSNVLVQVSIKDIDKVTIEKLYSLGVSSVITYAEAHKILNLINFLQLYNLDKLNPIFNYIKPINGNGNNNRLSITQQYIEVSPIFIIHPQKTGDATLINTFKKNNIKHHFTNHNSNFINSNRNYGKIKITTSVREPVSRMVSKLYQLIAADYNYSYMFSQIKDINCFFKNGGDTQTFLDNLFYSNHIYDDIHFNLTKFLDTFKNNILDLSLYPFDKEKGYSIVKEGNIEIFVYQLEKMNHIVKEMSEWIGETEFDEWVIANEADNKWIADSYKIAQKEIKIPREYFDKCYSDPWMKHFYSEKDIEKFKERWRPHIKD